MVGIDDQEGEEGGNRGKRSSSKEATGMKRSVIISVFKQMIW